MHGVRLLDVMKFKNRTEKQTNKHRSTTEFKKRIIQNQIGQINHNNNFHLKKKKVSSDADL